MFGFMIYPIRQGDEQPNIGSFFWDQNPAGSMDFPCITMYPSMKHPTNSCTTYTKNPRIIRIHVLLSSTCHVLSWYIVQNNNLTVLSAQTPPLVLAYARCR